jgi:septal ring factor EnvC (AmiA/AmiB activator)
MAQRGRLLVLGFLFLATSAAFAQQPPAVRKSAADEQRSLLNQLAEAQKWSGEQLWHMKDANDAREDEVQKLRDEVKGLYVETSSLRQQLDELKSDIGGVNANVSGFRTFSGFFIAVMILLLAVIFLMTIRR